MGADAEFYDFDVASASHGARGLIATAVLDSDEERGLICADQETIVEALVLAIGLLRGLAAAVGMPGEVLARAARGDVPQ
jgi:hypothetical protein